ncbi:PREDICTED: zinc transporter 7-like [Camelina sativa]|uniref:Zinc transporter 7-like n=1 Tax=Camelina sativa TaxID=90675 RepID=A0ABM0VNF2_CAMSA|nr:PREDICTED: zinc transporter 7-like [Camelina sativa]
MASTHQIYKLMIIAILFLSFTLTSLAENAELASVPQCISGPHASFCSNSKELTKLKIIAIFSILVASIIGVSLPLFTQGVPALGPDRDIFVIVKALASGVILATGYMHVLPDSFYDLNSPCLPRNPWKKFPFTTFIAMLSALMTLMVDSYAMSWHKKRMLKSQANIVETLENGSNELEKENGVIVADREDAKSQLIRHQVIAQVLELGIIVHFVVIGLAMGASDNKCTIRSLIAALCFHQLFEGMGLGGCILQAQYGKKTSWTMVVFFSVTTPLGIVLGMLLQTVYSPTSPTALIVVGVLNACSAGLLNYMALVNLLGADFLGPKLQGNMKLQTMAYVAVFLGAGGMSLMAKWA